MSNLDRIHYARRRLFGVVKRPLFDVARALTGQRLQSTAEYFDFGIYGGTFDAPAEAVQKRIASRFEVVERRPGWTELEIWAADYRHVDILRPYREVAVLAPVRLVRSGEPEIEGAYVLQMVVTSEEARWTGVDIHGFPKIVADVDVLYEEGSVSCACHHRGVHVLTLRVDTRPTSPIEDRAILLNVRQDGRLIRTDFERIGELGESEGPGGVSIALGDHAIADQLREIGVRLESGRAMYLPRCHAVLGKAIDLGPLAAPAMPVRRPKRGGEIRTPAELRPS